MAANRSQSEIPIGIQLESDIQYYFRYFIILLFPIFYYNDDNILFLITLFLANKNIRENVTKKAPERGFAFIMMKN